MIWDAKRVSIMLNGKNVLSQTQVKKIRKKKWEESRDASENSKKRSLKSKCNTRK